MNVMTGSTPQNPALEGELTLAALQWQNDVFRGRGGVSEEIRPLGFRPAFYDLETGAIHASRFANGSPAPMHLLDGLPDDLVACRLPSGAVAATRPGVVAGFERQGNFYTRLQASQAAAQMRDRANLLSHPEDHRALLSAWEHFVSDGRYPADLLRPVVEGSWSRCLRFGLDPELPAAPLAARQRQAAPQPARLREAAQPILQRAGAVLAHCESVALLTGNDGMIVDVAGDARTRLHAEDYNLAVGGLWAEEAVGTNAIGTALAEEQPVQLYGGEHYCGVIKRWTCSAEVIRDPHDGHVLGVFDISGLTDSYRDHALEFAITGARLIEANLASAYFRARREVIEGSAESFQHWPGEGLLAFDRHGQLARANGAAHLALRRIDANLAMTPQTRIEALDLDADEPAEAPPPWLGEPHRHPIVFAHRVVGTLIVLPHSL
ncbi:MAG: hypothetical protein JNM61_10145 [Zoogloeaceae bacterium]|nr:hypothetical protein [Zoogloeaceae bacterium]